MEGNQRPARREFDERPETQFCFTRSGIAPPLKWLSPTGDRAGANRAAAVTVPRALIAQTIDLVAVLAACGAARALAELAAVKGLSPTGDYVLTPAGEP
jgi:hypothetical protein